MKAVKSHEPAPSETSSAKKGSDPEAGALEREYATSSQIALRVRTKLTVGATGDPLRLVLQADATSLPSGRYDYTLELTARFDRTYIAHEYEGHASVVNRHDEEYPFGRGWQLAGLSELVIESGGVLWVRSSGSSHWLAWDGSSE